MLVPCNTLCRLFLISWVMNCDPAGCTRGCACEGDVGRPGRPAVNKRKWFLCICSLIVADAWQRLLMIDQPHSSAICFPCFIFLLWFSMWPKAWGWGNFGLKTGFNLDSWIMKAAELARRRSKLCETRKDGGSMRDADHKQGWQSDTFLLLYCMIFIQKGFALNSAGVKRCSRSSYSLLLLHHLITTLEPNLTKHRSFPSFF
jgi:hypothetical protein